MELKIAEVFVLCLCLQVQGYVGQTSRFGCSIYIFYVKSAGVEYSWKESKTLCENNGSQLVSIESSEAELNFLKNTTKAMNISQSTEYFIGLRRDNGNWKWISNNRTVEASKGEYPWNTNEPSGNGNCAKIFFNSYKQSFVYDDIECNKPQEKVGYICERQLVECIDKTGYTTRLSTTRASPVTLAAIQQTTHQQSSEGVSTEGHITRLSTNQALPVTSASTQLTLSTQQQSTDGVSNVSTEEGKQETYTEKSIKESSTRLTTTQASPSSTLSTQHQSDTDVPTIKFSSRQSGGYTYGYTTRLATSRAATQQTTHQQSSKDVSTEGKKFPLGCSSYIFHVASAKISWEKSKTLCENNGSKLVSMENVSAELNKLKKTTQAIKSEYFIGLRKVNGEWRWISNNSTVDGTKGKYPWHTQEPSGNGNCAKMFFNRRGNDLVYDDIECDKKITSVGYICERQLVECNDPNEHTTGLPTTQALPVTSEGIQSTLSTQQQSIKGVSTASTEATLTADTFDESPDVKALKDSSFLILITLSLLAVIILGILIIFFVLFARRRRSKKAKASLLTEQSSDRGHYLHSSTELTVHLSMSRLDEEQSTFKTVSESKEEYTYAVVDKSKRKSRGIESSNLDRGEEQNTPPDDGHFTNHPVSVESEERIEKTKAKEDRKDHVYAVVHIQQGNAAVYRDPALQEENEDATNAPKSIHEGGSHAELLNSSSLENKKEMTNSEEADGQNECGEYLYAAVDKASKKHRNPQMPPPYRGLVYADMSHLPENNTGNINRANPPTVYAAISHQRSKGAKSRPIKESADQETTYDNVNNNEL